MVAVPADTPPTVPPLTVATPVAVLLHVPPVATSTRVVADPTHTVVVPVMDPATGDGLIVTTCVDATLPQPFVTVYDIVAVPADTPPTVPPLTVATPVAVLLHVPPVATSASVVVEPAHTVAVPVIVPATGSGLTV